mmetsp:Transcript_10253/g.26658  ORF Transcript_10253/g.26658 Transcript_10253/m.26658 type:complete len:207 (-) Transcript_10253:291-911(-)
MPALLPLGAHGGFWHGYQPHASIPRLGGDRERHAPVQSVVAAVRACPGECAHVHGAPPGGDRSDAVRDAAPTDDRRCAHHAAASQTPHPDLDAVRTARRIRSTRRARTRLQQRAAQQCISSQRRARADAAEGCVPRGRQRGVLLQRPANRRRDLQPAAPELCVEPAGPCARRQGTACKGIGACCSTVQPRLRSDDALRSLAGHPRV